MGDPLVWNHGHMSGHKTCSAASASRSSRPTPPMLSPPLSCGRSLGCPTGGDLGSAEGDRIFSPWFDAERPCLRGMASLLGGNNRRVHAKQVDLSGVDNTFPIRSKAKIRSSHPELTIQSAPSITPATGGGFKNTEDQKMK